MEARNGHINWGNWSLDYHVADTEGLSLLKGFYRGRRVFHKLSLPVIRVKYIKDEDLTHNPMLRNGCGPYNDQISWDPFNLGENWNPIRGPHHLMKLGDDCGNKYVCVTSFNKNDTTWLELGVYARIGAYHIYQVWYLNNKGVILPRVYSKGLSCFLNHWHHPYWRFDIDLDEIGNQRVNVFEGDKWVGFVNREGRFLNKWFNHNARYNIENLRTGLKAWIFPPRLDSEHGIVDANEFSSIDVYIRKYRSEEDRPWPHKPHHEIGFSVHEDPDNSDIVFWSVGHLFHNANEGEDHWHSVGPTIWFDLPRETEVEPWQRRRVKVKGNIHIKDFKLVGNDRWGHFQFDEWTIVTPFGQHQEIFVRKGPVGDVSADLTLRIDWNFDGSIAVNFSANLFDGNELVAQTGTHFNVLRDASIHWSGLHLHDKHTGDPDTADIDFDIVNEGL